MRGFVCVRVQCIEGGEGGGGEGWVGINVCGNSVTLSSCVCFSCMNVCPHQDSV